MQKVKVKVNKLEKNPLFVKFLNWERDKYSVENWLSQISFEDPASNLIVKDTVKNIDENWLISLDDFHKNFQKYINAFINSYEIDPQFVQWLSNSTKYLEEIYVQDNNVETKKLKIKEKENWFPALICFNFVYTYNYFNKRILKRCPVCKSYFAHKGQYAKYCSDSCKGK